jgi:putative colanic acid biosynthesis acetyltransferase WcaF
MDEYRKRLNWFKPHSSPFNKRVKIKSFLWWISESILFRPSPHFMKKWRINLLRLFGAKIGKNCFIESTVKIFFPWNIEMGDSSAVNFGATLYALDKIKIGNFVSISQGVHINTASHDYRSPTFTLITKPVIIKDGAFIGTETYINFGITVNEMAVIGARSVVTKDIPANMVCVGHPCKPIKERLSKEKFQTIFKLSGFKQR